jgi:methionyl-tRNA formyltransferase
MLINGESQIGATVILANKNFDQGGIILQKSTTITYPIKIQTAIDIMSSLYADMLIILLDKITKRAPLNPTPQDEKRATYSVWRDENDYHVDWTLEASKIARTIDALSKPYKGARATLNGEGIIITQALTVPDLSIENRVPGKTLFMEHNNPVVICGSGLLKILEAHYETTKLSILPLKKFRSRFE